MKNFEVKLNVSKKNHLSLFPNIGLGLFTKCDYFLNVETGDITLKKKANILGFTVAYLLVPYYTVLGGYDNIRKDIKDLNCIRVEKIHKNEKVYSKILSKTKNSWKS